MKTIYFGSFSDKEGIISNFADYDSKSSNDEINKDLEGAEILFAAYGGRSYEGCAIVIIEKNNKVYEVNGSHCSCNGLEGQWGMEETTWEALGMRTLDSDEYEQDAIAAFRNLINFKLNNGEESWM